MKKIDFEAHFFTKEYLQALSENKGYPRFVEGDEGGKHRLYHTEDVGQPYGNFLLNPLLDLGEGRIKNMDNAGIDEREDEQSEADEAAAARERSGWDGLYFGGVAFKYQRPVEDLTRAARLAVRYMDVVTTSGPGTGIAAARDKIAEMKEAVGGFPLAIASGITPENVSDYLDVTDCFLVATGISRSFTELDLQKVCMLIEQVRSGT